MFGSPFVSESKPNPHRKDAAFIFLFGSCLLSIGIGYAWNSAPVGIGVLGVSLLILAGCVAAEW